MHRTAATCSNFIDETKVRHLRPLLPPKGRALEHFRDPLPVLREMTRVLGFFYMLTGTRA